TQHLVEEDNLQVLSIIGIGGIGKTTIARQVFNHERVKNHFEELAWVCVSQQFTRKDVWQTILRNLQPKYEEITKDEIQNKLFGLLETQTYLIVLDDIWKEEDWDRIKPIFPQKKGWKVILTSRNEDVALRADPTYVTFKPQGFTHEESWKLFQKIAFPKNELFSVDEEMREIGKEMIKYCGGLPLAIQVLGGLLAAQYTMRQWRRVYENFGSQFLGKTSFGDDNGNLVYHVLSLSYEELPIYLKQFFLYLAHFPEDCVMNVEKLSYYWAAEGILKPRCYDGDTIRDVADDYIEELVKRNMVIAERDDTSLRFETCQLHDMMREICLLKAKEENFLQMIDARGSASNSHSQSSICKSRRLVVHLTSDTFHEEGEMHNTKLRSLLFPLEYFKEGWTASSLSFTRLQLLRVLDLSRAKFEGGKLPSNIGKLIHLRYLSLYHAWVSHLPYTLQNLKLLLYLNLYVNGESPVYVPNILKVMQGLTYLALPKNMHDKTKLELGNLTNLEIMNHFQTKHSSLRDLGGITRLRTLYILYNGGCNMEMLSSSLSALRHLESLSIRDFTDNVYVGDAQGFVLDCPSLTYLSLQMYMPRLPDEHQFPPYLKSIFLSCCCLEEDPFPILEQLLHLNVVSFGGAAFYGKRMVCSAGGFPQLKELYLHGLGEWEEWIVEAETMPVLHTLYIGYCESLKALPDGLRSLTSLKALKIGMMKREFKGSLQKEGKDYDKVRHIPRLVFL
ncbi:hypothetical protein N665_0660s0003, partial [Sinapis alba]